MASRRLSKSVSAAIKAHNALSRPSILLRSRALSACAHFSSRSSSNSFIGVSGNGITSSATQAASRGQLLPLSLQFPSPRSFSDKSDQTDDNDKALEKYGSDLTEMAKQGKLPPLIGRDDEVNRFCW